MSNLNFSYGIRSNLPAHPESPASIGAKFVNTLEALSRIDLMVFPNWEVMDFPARDSLPLAAARPRIAAIIDNNVSRDDFGEPEPYGGYSAGAYTSHSFSPRGMNLRIRAGVRYVPRSSGGDVSSLQGRAARDQRDLASAWACAYAFRMDYDKVPLIPGAALFPYSRFHIPWLAYLSAPFATGIELPPEIKTERTPDGGLLMSATEERLDPTDPEHLRRARILADTMIAGAGHRSS